MARHQSSAHISVQLQAALECIHVGNWLLANLILSEAAVAAKVLDGTLPLNRVRRAFIAEAREAVLDQLESHSHG